MLTPPVLPVCPQGLAGPPCALFGGAVANRRAAGRGGAWYAGADPLDIGPGSHLSGDCVQCLAHVLLDPSGHVLRLLPGR